MYQISHKVINFIEKTMKIWRVELTAGEKSLTEIKIEGGIFQGDALSPLLFIIVMMPLNHILRKCTAEYKLSRSQEKISHLMYTDDIKLFEKNEKELETLMHTEYTVRIWHRKMYHASYEKRQTTTDRGNGTEGMELTNQDKIRTLGEKETYKYLGILEPDTIKQIEIKGKTKKDYFRRTRKLPETKLYSRNLIKEINSWTLLFVRYSGPFLKGTREELKKID